MAKSWFIALLTYDGDRGLRLFGTSFRAGPTPDVMLLCTIWDIFQLGQPLRQPFPVSHHPFLKAQVNPCNYVNLDQFSNLILYQESILVLGPC